MVVIHGNTRLFHWRENYFISIAYIAIFLEKDYIEIYKQEREVVCVHEDFVWFMEHYSELCKKYGNKFLAIKDQQILGVYESYGDAVIETQKSETIGSFIVQECSTTYNAYQCCISSMNFV